MIINLIYTILPIVTMMIGFYVGFYINKHDELPKVKSLAELIEENKEKVKVKAEKNKTDVYLENIDNYPNNQKDIKE